ncbi:MAG: RagB/SusD family nutrient uptake outer membrane protein, partial [Sphingobacteriaceae bacterium]
MKIKVYLSVFCAFLIVTSCKKVTNQIPNSVITATNFYQTATDADNTINACYDALQGNPANMEIWGDGRTDIFASTDRSNSAELQVVNGNVSSNSGYDSWSSLYAGINRCNSVLKHIPDITDAALASRKERILGEAYFLRGLFYFYLARTYENAPLILQPYEDLSGDFLPKNSDRATLFVQIEADFKAAESRVPDVPFSTNIENKGKTTKGAIHAAMADLYLWEKKYQQAADAANLVIGSSAGYTLVSGVNFATIFTAKNTTESIFEVEFNYSYLEGNSNSLSDTFLPLGGSYTAGNWRLQPSAALLAALPATDLRAPITYKNTGNVPAPYRDANKIYIAKYPGTLVGSAFYLDANLVVYRLAEVILFRAEALNELGQTAQAIILLNQIRTRAGLTGTTATTQADVRLAIERERFAELAYEGKRYYDLVRTGRYAAVTG